MNPNIPDIYVPGGVTLTSASRSLLDTGFGGGNPFGTLVGPSTLHSHSYPHTLQPHDLLLDFPPLPLQPGEYGTGGSDKLGGRSTYDFTPVTSNPSSLFQPQRLHPDLYSSSTLPKQYGGAFSVQTPGPSPLSISTFDPHRHVYPLGKQRAPSPGLVSNHSCSSSEGSYHPSTSFPMEDQSSSKRPRCRVSSSYHHHRKKPCLISNLEGAAEKNEDSRTCSSRCTVTPPDEGSKKQNHSEIEKRRRDKMNTYITELAGIVPVCGGISWKLDKLTVLRMAVQHMRTIRGTQLHSDTDGHYKPSYISDPELKHLILQAADGFLFVVGCDRGKLLYVSESVTEVLNYTQAELLCQSWFDILHPKDVAKVKEQLSDLAPRERLFIDIRTMLPVKGNPLEHHWGSRLCPGARRSFFCRMKCKSRNGVEVKKESNEGNVAGESKEGFGSQSPRNTGSDNSREERKYKVIHCLGYMKPWPKTENEDTDVEMEMDDTCNLSCLVAVGRILPTLHKGSMTSLPLQFTSRHAADGKFVFVDQRATLVLGILPQELIGSSMYDFYHHDDIPKLSQVHKMVLASSNESMTTPVYRFRTSDSSYVSLESDWKAFRNPWTREVEYLIATNRVIAYDDVGRQEFGRARAQDDYGESEAFSCGVEVNSPGNVEQRRSGTLLEKERPPLHSLPRSGAHEQERPQNVFQPLILGDTEQVRMDVLPCLASMPNFSTGYSMTTGNANNESTITLTNLTSHLQQNQSEFSSSHIQDLIMLNSPRRVSPGPGRSIATLLNNSNTPQGDEIYMMGDPGRGLIEPSDPSFGPEGSEEAAMAVIMSLLESEAGISGPSDLPWSLS